MTQPQLPLDELRTCPCGAQRPQDCKATNILSPLERRTGPRPGLLLPRHLPDKCLRRHDPATAPWPDGF